MCEVMRRVKVSKLIPGDIVHVKNLTGTANGFLLMLSYRIYDKRMYVSWLCPAGYVVEENFMEDFNLNKVNKSEYRKRSKVE